MALLSVQHLRISFPASACSNPAPVVDDLSFDMESGEILALVGESGSGKSLTALALMQLLPNSAQMQGEVQFQEESLSAMSERELQRLRGNKIAMIFQEPMTALNPLHKIGRQLCEVLLQHHPQWSKGQLNQRVNELCEEVGLSHMRERLDIAYPHQLSGGERQRLMIAMAIACSPTLLLADEPTTAIDVSLQKQILELLVSLKEKYGLTVLFITHDLKQVEQIADRVLVMKQGKKVELTDKKGFFRQPAHSYSRKLLASRPAGQPPALPSFSQAVLSVENLCVSYPQSRHFWGKVRQWKHAVEDVSFTLHKGETLGVIGESGCGKSTLAFALLRLLPHQARLTGKIQYREQNLVQTSPAKMRHWRKYLQIVFQDPFSTLNPRLSIAESIGEGLRVHERNLNDEERRDKVRRILRKLELNPDWLDRYPHEFSGGQRQRIALARALILEPEMVLMDEPTSALDMTVQAQIVALIHQLQKELGLSIIFISHDLHVVRALSHRMAVMHQGKWVEIGPTEELFESPQHIYTKRLIAASL